MGKHKTIFFALLPLLYLIILLFQKDLAMMADLGRHLKIGELVLSCWCVPQTNLFSYTHPNFPIVNHEWLAEVIFYLTSRLGLSALLVLKMILVTSTATLFYLVALKKGSLFWVTVFSLLSLTIFSTRFFVLPELFSYLFMGLFVFIIERYSQTKNRRLLLLLPVLELLWVNMHIYFPVGFGIFGLFVAQTWLKERKVPKQLVGILGAIVVVMFLNPSFIKGAFLPFTIFHNYGLAVEENYSPFAVFNAASMSGNVAYTLYLQVAVFELLLGLFAVTLFVKQQWKQLLHLGTGIFGALVGIQLVRCISVFGVLGFIPLVAGFTEIERTLRKTMEPSFVNILKGFVALGVFLIVFFHIKGLIDYQILSFSFVPSTENAATFMVDNHIKGRIFNNYRIGNYLIYRLYPQEQIFVDARPEAYPASFFADYFRMFRDPAYFEEQAKQYSINAIVMALDDDPTLIRPFLINMLQNPNWVPVYGDGIISIFVRDNDLNKGIIEKYRIVIPQQQ